MYADFEKCFEAVKHYVDQLEIKYISVIKLLTFAFIIDFFTLRSNKKHV